LSNIRTDEIKEIQNLRNKKFMGDVIMDKEKIKLSYSMNSSIDFSLLRNSIPMINDMKIENNSENSLRDLRVEIKSDLPFIKPYTCTNAIMKAGEASL